MSNFGYAYPTNGYVDRPEIGIFNPPRSLFTTDATLYNSLFATKAKPGKAWKSNLAGLGAVDNKNFLCVVLIIAAILAYKKFS